MITEPIHITDSAFEKTVIKSTVPVLVDFWAPWCSPCRSVAPILDKLAKEFSGKMLIGKVNIDENPETQGHYAVSNIPTMLFFVNGQIAYRQTGALPEGILRMMITQFIEVAAAKLSETNEGK